MRGAPSDMTYLNPKPPVLDSGDEKVSRAERGRTTLYLGFKRQEGTLALSLTLLQVSLNQHNVYLRLLWVLSTYGEPGFRMHEGTNLLAPFYPHHHHHRGGYGLPTAEPKVDIAKFTLIQQ